MRQIKPLPYQEPIIKALIASLIETGRALLVMATGTGKTLTTGFVLRALLTRRTDRLLFVCHNSDILEHAMRELRKIFGEDESFGIFTGKKKRGLQTSRFVFATLQTINLHKKAFARNAFTAVVVDESHHSQAETFKSAIQHFKPKYLLGMTATPDRLDGRDIRDMFGAETWILTLEEAIGKGYLTPVTYRLMTIGSLANGKLEELLKEVREEGRRVSISQLNETLFIDRMDEEIAKVIEKEKGSQIIFCENTTHTRRFAALLTNAAEYHSGRSDQDNERVFRDFSEGRLKKLLTVNKFNEGVDMPDANVVVFLRATESPTIFFQQLGRGLRRSPGKSRVIVLDFVANVERIAAVQKLMAEIEDYAKDSPSANGEEPRDVTILKGDGFDFGISAEALDILELLKRARMELCSYEEAMAKVRDMDIKTKVVYHRRYREDPQLPSEPQTTYASSGWKSWPLFLRGKERPLFYSYEEALLKLQVLEIKTTAEYRIRYPEDSRLPSNPDLTYASSGWKSWIRFLGRKERPKFYSYEEAATKAQKLGIRTREEYLMRYREDPRLPSHPHEIYATSGWKSWRIFLGGKERSNVCTYEEALVKVERLGIKTAREYKKCYPKDSSLPANPDKEYSSSGWKSWTLFLLGRKKRRQFYSYKEASARVQEMGIKKRAEYKKLYPLDPRLPSNPDKEYASSGWVSSSIFFGRKRYSGLS